MDVVSVRGGGAGCPFHSHTLPYSDRWLGYEGEDGELGGYKVYDAEKGNAADTSEFHGYGWDNHELRKLVHAFQYGQQLDFKKTVIDVDDENDGVTDHRWISYERTVDFTQQGAMKVLGWFAGHCHADCHATVYGLNLSISTCTCASQRKDWSLDPSPSKPAPERKYRVIRFYVYRRMFTPQEVEKQYIDQSVYESNTASIGMVREVISLPDGDVLLGIGGIYEDVCDVFAKM